MTGAATRTGAETPAPEAVARPRSCHRCRWNGAGSDVCLSCPGPAEESNRGQSFVSLDAMPAPAEFLERHRRPVERGAGGVTATLTPEVEAALVLVLSSFMGMDDRDLVIFRHLYHGEDYAATAKAMGVTKQYVSKRVFALAHRHPIVTAVVNVMKRRGIGGARRGQRRDGLFQGDLFDVDAGGRAGARLTETADVEGRKT